MVECICFLFTSRFVENRPCLQEEQVNARQKKKIEQSREARSESRRIQNVLTSRGEDVSDLLKFNQLKVCNVLYYSNVLSVPCCYHPCLCHHWYFEIRLLLSLLYWYLRQDYFHHHNIVKDSLSDLLHYICAPRQCILFIVRCQCNSFNLVAH